MKSKSSHIRATILRVALGGLVIGALGWLVVHTRWEYGPSSAQHGQSNGDGEAALSSKYCERMVKLINSVAAFTSTKCAAEAGKNGVRFGFLSSAPVFSTESAKKQWLVAVIRAIDDVLDDTGTAADSIFVSDQELFDKGKGYFIAGSVAHDLRIRASSGLINVQTMYEGILAAMQLTTLHLTL